MEDINISIRLQKFKINKIKNTDRMFRMKLKNFNDEVVNNPSIRYSKRSLKFLAKNSSRTPFKTTNLSKYRYQLRDDKSSCINCLEFDSVDEV